MVVVMARGLAGSQISNALVEVKDATVGNL